MYDTAIASQPTNRHRQRDSRMLAAGHFDVFKRVDEGRVVVDGGDHAALVLLAGGLWAQFNRTFLA